MRVESNIVKDKARDFAIRIINLYKHLTKNRTEFIISAQILRSGTSIGANIAEALRGASKKDFRNKMYIAYKECGETLSWLDLLHATEYLSSEEYLSINNDCEEISKILSSITKTTRYNITPHS